jgi:formate C-acetyltransferase
MVFMSDEKIIESLIKQGAEPADAAKYHVVGCYECGADGELPSTCNGNINIAKALELALNGGRDMLTEKQLGLENDGKFESYDELFSEFVRQINNLCAMAMKATDLHEAHYSDLHSAPFLSSTYPTAFENGEDLYCDYAAKYNNSSVNAIGLATAIDSLAAVRRLVYEDKTMTLGELCDILMSDWEGKEALRLTVKNRFPKYGNGIPEVDVLARDTVKHLSSVISGRPNAKGGKYRLGLFSINWRWEMGEKTAATPDGRRKGETLSQNSSATFGADKNGATAHLLSAAVIDGSDTPNASIVDIDLHSSAVQGENGTSALYTALMTFIKMGGFGVHYNVLNTEVLKKAKERPSDHPNLQVRLCGWNVLFSSLSEREKDEFIARSVK